MKLNLRLILALPLLFIGAQSISQTFSLSGYSPIYNVTDPWQDTESHVSISNTSSTLKRVTIARTINTIAAGHLEFFCFGSGATGLCYPPGTPNSNGNDTILAGVTDNSFKATLRPLGNYGYTSIHFRIFDTSNPADSIGVDLAWDFTTSLQENQQKFGLSKPQQNPADAYTVFNYNLISENNADRLVVYNMLGAVVKTMDIPGKSGVLVLTTSDLKAGMYLVSYVSGGKSKDSCRLVVAHR